MNYSKEFKEEALKLSDEIGLKKAAAQLGIKYYTLADWRSKRKEQLNAPRLTDAEQQHRIRELERENAELRRANDILKDALGFLQKTGRSKSKRTSPVHSQTQRELYCKRDVQGTENQRIGLLQMAEKSQQTYQTAASSGRDQQRSFCS